MIWLILGIAAFTAWGVAAHFLGRLARHGPHALIWRWLTGMPWHGKPLTNRGWLRKGTPPAKTHTGHATRFHFMPRWQHALWRSGPTIGAALAIYGWIADRAVTEGWLVIFLVAAAYWSAWRGWRWRTHRELHREWMTPLHMRLAPMLDIPVVDKPESWLQIAPARDYVKIALPQSFHPDAKDKDRIRDIVATTVGMHDNCEPHWDKLTGPEPYVTFTRSEPPPELVTLADLRQAIDRAPVNQLVLGIGKERKIITVSLAGDSPHIGLSMPSGDGKSVIAQLLLAQILYQGGIGLIIDNKLFSHPWALHAMPNIRYAGTPEQIHAALVWLGDEIERRKQVALHSIDMQGNVHADVGPQLLVVGEELNATTGKLRKYWRSIGGTGPSPAIEVLEEAAFVGRQVKIHLLMIAQLLTSKASGGSGNDSSARENCGVRILGGNSSANAWKMLAPEVTRPPKTPRPGRVQVVTRRGVEECQIGFLNPSGRANTPEARHLALAGAVTPVPAGMPAGLAASTGTPPAQIPAPDLCGSTEAGPAINRARVTLREAAGTVVPYTLSTLRTYRHDDPSFPEPVGVEGLAEVFEAGAVRAWAAERKAAAP